MNQLNDEHYRAHCAQLASLERAYQDLSRKIETLRRWAKRDRTYWSFEKTAGYTDAQRQVRDIIDPPKPKWREMVDGASRVVADNPLEHVLMRLSVIASDPSAEGLEWNLARIVALCEAQVGDGWKADPDRVPVGHWGISWLLVTLSKEPPAWHVLGDRAAAWLRSLTDGGVA